MGRSSIEAHFGGAGVDVQVHSGIEIGFLDAADIAERIPVHGERPGFVGLEPTVIGLMVRVGAHHQLDARAVGIAEGGIPSPAAGAVAPAPEFFTGYDVVVGHAHGAGLFAVVVAGKEIVIVIPGEDRIRGEVVLVPTDIDAFGEIGAAIGGMGNRPAGKLAFGVVYAELGAGREDHLVVLIGVDGEVGEAEHGVHFGGAVEDPHGGFQDCLAGPQRVSHGPAHALAHFQLTHPDGLTAIGIFLHFVLHGDESAGAMVMRDIPLHAAGHPGADEADEGRLDDVLAIDEVIVVGLIDAFENAAADLRQDADLEVLVFQIDDGVSLVDFSARQRVVHGVGVDRSLRALRLAAEEERGVRFRVTCQISGDDNVGFPYLYAGNIGGERGSRRP